MSEQYEGRQFVGMDLRRRRSVLVRMTESGEALETVRIVNDRDALAAVVARAGVEPEAVTSFTVQTRTHRESLLRPRGASPRSQRDAASLETSDGTCPESPVLVSLM
jgi:hypothetical protein